MDRDAANAARYRPDAAGFYESWFLRANAPDRSAAFWIRYTVTAPAGHPDDAVAELWAVYFDASQAPPRLVAVRQPRPAGRCTFAPEGLDVRVGEATLRDGAAAGRAVSGRSIGWSLAWTRPLAPLLLLPERLYAGGFPKAKSLVPAPNAVFRGELNIDGQTIDVSGWRGSQNHNWGSRHTDAYAWCQVAGFDQDPSAFLECAVARVRLGPVMSPRLSPAVLWADGCAWELNGIRQSLRNRGRSGGLELKIDARGPEARLRVIARADAATFAGLRYPNPIGGEKICLNSKLAACEVTLERPGLTPLTLTCSDRAALEILQDAPHPEIPMLA